MNARTPIVAAALALCAAFVVACGGDDSNKADTSAAPAAAQTTSTQTDTVDTETTTSTDETTTTDTVTTDDATTTSSTGTVPTSLAAAVAACKAQFTSNSALSSDVKDRLLKLCDAAGKKDEAATRKAAKEACTEIAKAVFPEGATRDATIATCKKADDG